MDKILVVCAHPDDETLGLGGTIIKNIKKGAKVYVLAFTDGELSREKVSDKKIKKRRDEFNKACNILGVHKTKFLDFKDQQLDNHLLMKLAKEIEIVIKEWKPNIVYTHFWGDMNQDHRQLFDATLIATRPSPWSNINKILCYETPSSTEWGNENFCPNLFIDIEKELPIKLKALKQYKHEIEKFPHPRSIDSIKNRSKYFGSSVGIKNAEAFFVLREIIRK